MLVPHRPVHGSVQVGFVPNPKPTRPDRMARISTRCQPEWLIGSALSSSVFFYSKGPLFSLSKSLFNTNTHTHTHTHKSQRRLVPFNSQPN